MTDQLEFIHTLPRNTTLKSSLSSEDSLLICVGEMFEVRCKYGSVSNVLAGKVQRRSGILPSTLSSSPWHRQSGLGDILETKMRQKFSSLGMEPATDSSRFKELYVLPSGKLWCHGKGFYSIKDFGGALSDRETLIAKYRKGVKCSKVDDATESYMFFAASSGQWMFPWITDDSSFKDLPGISCLYKTKFGRSFFASREVMQAMKHVIYNCPEKRKCMQELAHIVNHETVGASMQSAFARKLSPGIEFGVSRTPVEQLQIPLSMKSMLEEFDACLSMLPSPAPVEEERVVSDVTTIDACSREAHGKYIDDLLMENGMVYIPIQVFGLQEALFSNRPMKPGLVLVTIAEANEKGYYTKADAAAKEEKKPIVEEKCVAIEASPVVQEPLERKEELEPNSSDEEDFSSGRYFVSGWEECLTIKKIVWEMDKCPSSDDLPMRKKKNTPRQVICGFLQNKFKKGIICGLEQLNTLYLRPEACVNIRKTPTPLLVPVVGEQTTTGTFLVDPEWMFDSGHAFITKGLYEETILVKVLGVVGDKLKVWEVCKFFPDKHFSFFKEVFKYRFCKPDDILWKIRWTFPMN